jgi:nucleoside diphosphate kinase
MSGKWFIYMTAEVRADRVGKVSQGHIAEILGKTFFGDFREFEVMEQVDFPPQEPISTPNIIVLDYHANTYEALNAITSFIMPNGKKVFLLALFPVLSAARQRESFLVLAMPKAVEAKESGHILAGFEEAGFELYSIQYYLSAKPSIWQEHYEPHRADPNFDSIVANHANRPVTAYHFYLPGAPLQEAITKAKADFVQPIREGLIHVSNDMASAVRERGLWVDEYVEEEES